MTVPVSTLGQSFYVQIRGGVGGVGWGWGGCSDRDWNWYRCRRLMLRAGMYLLQARTCTRVWRTGFYRFTTSPRYHVTASPRHRVTALPLYHVKVLTLHRVKVISLYYVIPEDCTEYLRKLCPLISQEIVSSNIPGNCVPDTWYLRRSCPWYLRRSCPWYLIPQEIVSLIPQEIMSLIPDTSGNRVPDTSGDHVPDTWYLRRSYPKKYII